MQKLIVFLIIPLLIGCTASVPPKVVTAISLIQSASGDIRDHSIEHCKERIGAYIAQLTIEEAKPAAERDDDKIRDLHKKIADEQENLDALKVLPEALKDLEKWAKLK